MPAEAITTGILFGFTLSFSAGPVMFALIQTSIREGFFRALLMEIGIVLSDALFIIVAFYSLGQLIHENPLAQDIIITSGGMLLIGIGMFKFLHKPHMRRHVREMAGEIKSHAFGLLLRGFLFNTLNPSVIIFWLGAVSIVTSKFEGDESSVAAYFTATLSAMLFFDIIKAWFAQKLKRWITARRMLYIDKIVGIVFSIFGVVLFFKGLIQLSNSVF